MTRVIAAVCSSCSDRKRMFMAGSYQYRQAVPLHACSKASMFHHRSNSPKLSPPDGLESPSLLSVSATLLLALLPLPFTQPASTSLSYTSAHPLLAIGTPPALPPPRVRRITHQLRIRHNPILVLLLLHPSLSKSRWISSLRLLRRHQSIGSTGSAGVHRHRASMRTSSWHSRRFARAHGLPYSGSRDTQAQKLGANSLQRPRPTWVAFLLARLRRDGGHGANAITS